MAEKYLVDCPRCNKEVVEFVFCGCNGYVGFCKIEKELLYYCSIFQRVSCFVPTKQEIDLPYTSLKYKKDDE